MVKGVVIVLLFVILVGSFVSAFDYVLGNNVYSESTNNNPAKGELINDSNFNVEMIRISDDQTNPYPGGWVMD
ncbi:MAG: hypothetical protein ABII01_03105 [Candidatus Woesearchaeota archaeon]